MYDRSTSFRASTQIDSYLKLQKHCLKRSFEGNLSTVSSIVVITQNKPQPLSQLWSPCSYQDINLLCNSHVVYKVRVRNQTQSSSASEAGRHFGFLKGFERRLLRYFVSHVVNQNLMQATYTWKDLWRVIILSLTCLFGEYNSNQLSAAL